MSTHPPLPGMGRAAVRGKKKTLKQPTLPGFSNASVKGMRTSKPVSETPVKKEQPAKKRTFEQELIEGNRPIFMTSSEVTKHANLNDAGYRNETAVGDKKSKKQANQEKYVMARKLKESKTGTVRTSHTPREQQSGWTVHNGEEVRTSSLPSLHEEISKKGFKGSFPLLEAHAKVGMLGHSGNNKNFINVWEGHHRLATMRNINPKQFMAIDWHQT